MNTDASSMKAPPPPAEFGMTGFLQKKSSQELAFNDLKDGFRQWWMWSTMAWQDIRQRYRGSVLGPFWLTLSMMITIVVLGLLYSNLFHMELNTYLPFLCLGMITWALISSIILDGCMALITAENIIKQIKVPFSVHVYRVIYRNLIVAAHNIVVYLMVMLYFGIGVGVNTLLVIPGLLLVIVNGAWSVLLIGMICARFRDVPQVVGSLIQVVFFISPIIWRPELLGDALWLARLNPFFALIDIVREPMLNQAPPLSSWTMAIGAAMFGWTATFMFFTRFRARIPYWI